MKVVSLESGVNKRETDRHKARGERQELRVENQEHEGLES